jgi:hypothetical protein
MAGHRQFICEQAFFVLIHLLFQDHMNGLVVINAIVKPSSAGHDQAFITYLTGEAKNTQAGLISLLGVLFTVEYIMDIKPDILVYG